MRHAPLEAGALGRAVDAPAASARRTEIALDSGSPEATERIGARVGAILADGDVVALTGELGAGKTCLARGILRGLGVADVVQSPSFVVERRYAGRLAAHHLDLYRIEGARAIGELGIPDRFAESGVFVVEWADRAAGFLPDQRLEVAIEDLGGTERRVRIAGPRARLAPLAAVAG